MAIQYKSRNGKIYYLHVKQGKDGKVAYYFSQAQDGPLANSVPEGYEIYQHIRGQVLLRRKVPQIIREEELALVKEALERQPKGHFYQTEVKKNAIVIYEAEDRTEEYQRMAMPWINRARLAEYAKESADYQAVMRFVLADPDKRLFSAERFCFRGSVEDWIPISDATATLQAHTKKFIKHLGRESFFDLYRWTV
ncbi:MAG TPA: hypothetical protein VEC99_01795 [Clostridia bacterium]|nr:hypothetical protein [Clostridia bacterium]